MAYPYPIFSSPNQAVDSLFGREFGTYQFGEQLNEADAARALARDQIAAQRELAMAQLRAAQQQQEAANLFRMEEARARRDQLDRTEKLERERLGIDKAYKEGLSKRPDARTKEQIDEANKMSEAAASQLNAHYQSLLNTRKSLLEQERQQKLNELVTLGGFLGRDAAKSEINKKYDQMLKDLEDKTFTEVNGIGMQYFQQGSVGVDPFSKKFTPIKIPGGSDGGTTPTLPGGGGTTPGGTETPGTGTGENAPPVPFQLQGTPSPMTVPPSNVPGGAGARPTVWPGGVSTMVNPNVLAPAPTPYTPPPTSVYAPPTTTTSAAPALVYGPEVPARQPAADVVGLPPEWVPQASPYTPPPTDRVQVRLPYGLLDMSVADAQEMERQLRAVPPEQRGPLAVAIKNQLLNSGRARFIVTRP